MILSCLLGSELDRGAGNGLTFIDEGSRYYD
jgi:hypothetical protein